LIFALAAAPSVWAWGPQGHRVIARAASDRLTPAARAAIRDLLLEGDTLVTVASWPDQEGHDAVPGSAPWHYVNVPISAARYVEPKVGRSECVVEKIKEFRKVLADPKRPKRDRQRALLFLCHFVADIHQPLHVGDNNDRGGNLTQVQFFGEGTNLHKLWDSDLIRRLGGNDDAWTRRVEKAITPDHARSWSKGTPEDWATETLHAAQAAYRETDTAKTPLSSGVTLGDPYLRRAEPILIEQMARASVRLADELNAAFR
jgi:hypothetical protein